MAAAKLWEMVRSFTLRDFALVRRLSEHGISLHTESGLVDNLHPLRGALQNLVVRGDFPTLVWKSDGRDQAGFIQILLEEDRHHAHIRYLSPAIAKVDNSSGGSEPGYRMPEGAAMWLPLLDQAVIESGRLGAQSLVAEVDEIGPELPILRRAGFAVYTRQDIWVLTPDDYATISSSESSLKPEERQSSDDWDIQLLYANIVPRLVQLVEPLPPLETGDAWVLRDDQGELAAFIHVREGSEATWLRFFIHPNVEADAQDIVRTALLKLAPPVNRLVFCCVRRYEGWLPAALQRLGFQSWGSQAVMVKHTVHHTRRTSPKMVLSLENGGVPVSAPYIRHHPIQKNGKQTTSGQR